MNTWKNVLVLVACACATAYPAGYLEQYGYPLKGVVYKFVVYTGEKDRWDSATQYAPPLPPGKAARAAKEFVGKVPLRDDMKVWSLATITLRRMSLAPEEWVYVVHFDAVPKSGGWTGPVPSIEVPVRMDGAIPEPVVEKRKF